MRLIQISRLFGRGSPSASSEHAATIATEPSDDVASLRAHIVALESELRRARRQIAAHIAAREELMTAFGLIASGETRKWPDEKPGPPTARERMAIAQAMKIERERNRA